jgi:hypothetical protein
MKKHARVVTVAIIFFVGRTFFFLRAGGAARTRNLLSITPQIHTHVDGDSDNSALMATTTTTTTTIDALPDLALSRALTFLDAGELARSAAVCRRFASLIAADDALLWKPHVLAGRPDAVQPAAPHRSWRAEFASADAHFAARHARWWISPAALAHRDALRGALEGAVAARARLAAGLEGVREDLSLARARARRPTGARVAWADGEVVLTHGGDGDGGGDGGTLPAGDAERVHADLTARLAAAGAREAAARAALAAGLRAAQAAENVRARDAEQYARRRAGLEGEPAARRPPEIWPAWRPVAAGEGLPVSQAGAEADA